MLKHRINGDEANPKTECGLEVEGKIRGDMRYMLIGLSQWLGNESVPVALALYDEAPTCPECLAKES